MTYVVRRNNGLNMARDFEKMMDSVFNTKGSTCTAPAANVWEEKESYHAQLLIPGYNQEDLSIEVKDNLLTIKAKREEEKETQKKEYHLKEFSVGPFTRTFVLPKNSDSENVQASYQNGILDLTIGKSPEAKPKQIKINL